MTVACLDIPAFPLQLVWRQEPSWRAQPTIVIDRDRPQGKVLWTCERAREHGVLIGHRYAASLARCPGLRARVVPVEQIDTALDALRVQLAVFSPSVEVGEPGTFWLDGTGLARIFVELVQPGEDWRDAWGDAIGHAVSKLGFAAAVVIGRSRFATYAIARGATSAFGRVSDGLVHGDHVLGGRRVRPLAIVAPSARRAQLAQQLGLPVVTVPPVIATKPRASLPVEAAPLRVVADASHEEDADAAELVWEGLPHVPPLRDAIDDWAVVAPPVPPPPAPHAWQESPVDERAEASLWLKAVAAGEQLAAKEALAAQEAPANVISLWPRAAADEFVVVTGEPDLGGAADVLIRKPAPVVELFPNDIEPYAMKVAGTILGTDERAAEASRLDAATRLDEEREQSRKPVPVTPKNGGYYEMAERLDAADFAGDVVARIPPRTFGHAHASRPQAAWHAETHVFVMISEAEERAAASAVSLLRIDVEPKLRDALSRLGVARIGEMVRLPAGGVLERLGSEAHRLYQLALGERWDPLVPMAPPETLEERVLLDEEDNDIERLAFVIKAPLDRLVARLADKSRALVALHMELALKHAVNNVELRVDRIKPAAPTLDVRVLERLVHLRLTGAPPVAPVNAVRLWCEDIEATREQLALFAAKPRRDLRAANEALARLRAELGERAVMRAVLRDGHLPEASFAWEPLDELGPATPRPPRILSLVRRVLLEPHVLPPQARQVRDDGWLLSGLENGAVVRIVGPYIFNGGWWSHEIEREYHFAELRAGECLWVYYDRVRKRWIHQGMIE